MTVKQYCEEKSITVEEWVNEQTAKLPKWKQELANIIFEPYPDRGYVQNYSSKR